MAGQMRQKIRKVFASNHLLLSRYLHIVHSIFIYSSLWFSFLFFKENKKNKKFFHLFSILSHELSCYLSSLTGSNHSLIIKWNVNTENDWQLEQENWNCFLHLQQCFSTFFKLRNLSNFFYDLAEPKLYK